MNPPTSCKCTSKSLEPRLKNNSHYFFNLGNFNCHCFLRCGALHSCVREMPSYTLTHGQFHKDIWKFPVWGDGDVEPEAKYHPVLKKLRVALLIKRLTKFIIFWKEKCIWGEGCQERLYVRKHRHWRMWPSYILHLVNNKFYLKSWIPHTQALGVPPH